MGGNLNGWTGLIVLAIVLLLFGAPKLPALARSLGQSMKILRSEVRSDEKSDEKRSDVAENAAPSSVDSASSNAANVSNDDGASNRTPPNSQP